MGEYDRSIETAKRLIAKKGQTCQWRKTSQVVLDDPDRPWLGGDAPPQVYEPKIVFVPATDGASGFGLSKFRDQGTDVASFSTFGLMAPQDFMPEALDQVTRGGEPLMVVAVDTLAPAGEPVLHILSIV